MIQIGFISMPGYVVAPYGYHRGYYYERPRAVVAAPAPVVVVRPFR